MKIRAIAVSIVLVLCGLAIAFRSGVTGYVRPDERWLEARLPDQIGGYDFLRSQENPEQSYRMSEETYDLLDPIGIVCRVYESSNGRFDVVTISGDEPDTFHDQTWCFRAQGWQVTEERTEQLTTSLGTLPVRIIRVQAGGRDEWMSFVFRGPSGKFFDRFGGLWRDFMVNDLTRGRTTPASFLRVMGMDGQTDAQVLDFTVKAIDYGFTPYGMGDSR